jgi:hypothetical protein
MKYFLHDTNAFQDEKISELYIHYGYEGLGLFYTLLEKIAAQEKPIKTIVLKRQLNVGKKLEKCWSFMETIGIISSSNGETFNKQLLNFSEKYKIKKEKNAKRISEWRENQTVTENVTHSESVRNAPKVKESKVNRSKGKEKNNAIAFAKFWEMYGKSSDKKKCEDKFEHLEASEIETIFATLPKYVASTPDLQYRKNPLTYINGKCWNDNPLFQPEQPKKTYTRDHFYTEKEYQQYCADNNITPIAA